MDRKKGVSMHLLGETASESSKWPSRVSFFTGLTSAGGHLYPAGGKPKVCLGLRTVSFLHRTLSLPTSGQNSNWSSSLLKMMSGG